MEIVPFCDKIVAKIQLKTETDMANTNTEQSTNIDTSQAANISIPINVPEVAAINTLDIKDRDNITTENGNTITVGERDNIAAGNRNIVTVGDKNTIAAGYQNTISAVNRNTI